MNNFIITIILLTFMTPCYADAAIKDTSHLEVVKEYVRSLGAIYHIQEQSKIEMSEAQKRNEAASVFMTPIKISTSMKLELSTSINALKRMRLSGDFDSLIPSTIMIYQQKFDLHNEIVAMSKDALSATEAKDLNPILSRLPEIQAQIEYLDETLFKSMVLVFALLIDEKPDENGHMSHLIISKVEKKDLLRNIDLTFGSSLNDKNKNLTVSSAALLKGYLQKDYLCTDDWKK